MKTLLIACFIALHPTDDRFMYINVDQISTIHQHSPTSELSDVRIVRTGQVIVVNESINTIMYEIKACKSQA